MFHRELCHWLQIASVHLSHYTVLSSLENEMKCCLALSLPILEGILTNSGPSLCRVVSATFTTSASFLLQGRRFDKFRNSSCDLIALDPDSSRVGKLLETNGWSITTFFLSCTAATGLNLNRNSNILTMYNRTDATCN